MSSRSKNRGKSRPRPSGRENTHSDLSQPLARMSEEELYKQVEADLDDVLLLILDEVTDPHNLGACLRSANAAGALAIVTPRHHSAKVTDTVRKIACGAAEVTPVVSVTNLANAMRKLHDLGVFLIGTSDQATEDLYDTDLTGPLGIALGAEGKGLRRLTQENCDSLVSIPMLGTVECLNVSVATGVCLFEAVRQRGG